MVEQQAVCPAHEELTNDIKEVKGKQDDHGKLLLKIAEDTSYMQGKMNGQTEGLQATAGKEKNHLTIIGWFVMVILFLTGIVMNGLVMYRS